MAATPRDTLAYIASMYGYDPATVLSVRMEPNETTFTYRLADANTPGKYQITRDGYLITPAALAILQRLASGYGYNPEDIVSVTISQYESIVRYEVPKGDDAGTVLTQEDHFSITGPAPTPSVAPAPAGVPFGADPAPDPAPAPQEPQP